MALDTYAGIKSSVRAWMRRGDLDAVIPDFIAMAESQLARELRLWGMETSVDLPLSSGGAVMPSDMVEPTRLSVSIGNAVRQLVYVSAAQFANAQGTVGTPNCYTVLNGKFVVSPIPADGTLLTLTYFAKPAPLSDSNQTNLWSQVAADALLYSALLEASIFVKDDARIDMWQLKKKEAMGAIAATDERAQAAGPFRIRADNAR